MRSVLRARLSSVGLALHRLARLVGRGRAIRILYYHSVSDDPVRSSVNPAAFANQIEYLRSHRYDILSLSQAVRLLSARAALPERGVVVTLDDGFRDNYEQAFPVLKRYGVQATIFLTVSYIGTDRLPTLTRTHFVPSPLSWEQVQEMHAGGIEFGSHTMTHPMLSRIPPEAVRRELADSKRMIEDKLSARADFFCYPRGDFDDDVRRIVATEGYRAACTTLPGVNDCGIDLFALRRTYVSRRDSLEEFAKKVAGAYDLLQAGMRLWTQWRR